MQLQRDKIVFTDRECRQICGPYLEPDMPVFITSDSILNAYHVLLEESVLRLEAANSERLPAILEDMWRGLQTAEPTVQGQPELSAAARRRAQIVLGTAIRLLGGAAIEPEAEIATCIDQEVARVRAAEGQHKPAWLGPPDDPQLVRSTTRVTGREDSTRRSIRWPATFRPSPGCSRSRSGSIATRNCWPC